MDRIVSAAFISSVFSCSLQQLQAEPGSPGSSTGAGLETQRVAPVLWLHGDGMEEKRSPSASLAASLPHRVFKVHRGRLGLEREWQQ